MLFKGTTESTRLLLLGSVSCVCGGFFFSSRVYLGSFPAASLAPRERTAVTLVPWMQECLEWTEESRNVHAPCWLAVFCRPTDAQPQLDVSVSHSLSCTTQQCCAVVTACGDPRGCAQLPSLPCNLLAAMLGFPSVWCWVSLHSWCIPLTRHLLTPPESHSQTLPLLLGCRCCVRGLWYPAKIKVQQAAKEKKSWWVKGTWNSRAVWFILSPALLHSAPCPLLQTPSQGDGMRGPISGKTGESLDMNKRHSWKPDLLQAHCTFSFLPEASKGTSFHREWGQSPPPCLCSELAGGEIGPVQGRHRCKRPETDLKPVSWYL